MLTTANRNKGEDVMSVNIKFDFSGAHPDMVIHWRLQLEDQDNGLSDEVREVLRKALPAEVFEVEITPEVRERVSQTVEAIQLRLEELANNTAWRRKYIQPEWTNRNIPPLPNKEMSIDDHEVGTRIGVLRHLNQPGLYNIPAHLAEDYQEGDHSNYTKRLNNKRKGTRARTVFPGMSPIRAWGEVESIYAKPYRRVVRYYNGTVYVSGQTGGLVLSENRMYDHVMRGLTKQAPSGASMRKKAKYRSRIVNTFWTHDPLAKLSRSLLESRDAARALMQSDNITYGYDARKEELANLLSPQFTGKPPKRHKFDPTLDDDKPE